MLPAMPCPCHAFNTSSAKRIRDAMIDRGKAPLPFAHGVRSARRAVPPPRAGVCDVTGLEVPGSGSGFTLHMVRSQSRIASEAALFGANARMHKRETWLNWCVCGG